MMRARRGLQYYNLGVSIKLPRVLVVFTNLIITAPNLFWKRRQKASAFFCLVIVGSIFPEVEVEFYKAYYQFNKDLK